MSAQLFPPENSACACLGFEQGYVYPYGVNSRCLTIELLLNLEMLSICAPAAQKRFHLHAAGNILSCRIQSRICNGASTNGLTPTVSTFSSKRVASLKGEKGSERKRAQGPAVQELITPFRLFFFGHIATEIQFNFFFSSKDRFSDRPMNNTEFIKMF